MNTLSCDDVRGLLPLFIGDDLDEAAHETVRTHLVACHACRGQASAFQRSTADLRRLAGRPVDGVDEAMFASLQESIMARVEALPAEPLLVVGRWQAVRRFGLATAAMALLAVGFWWGQEQEPESLWNRRPVATPVVLDAPRAVPYAGQRAPMRLLGNDGLRTLDDATGDGIEGSGLRGRVELRSLVDDSLLLPPPPPPPKAPR